MDWDKLQPEGWEPPLPSDMAYDDEEDEQVFAFAEPRIFRPY